MAPATVVPLSREAARSTRAGLGLGVRSRTENVSRLPRRELARGRVHLRLLDEVDAARPRTRGDCAGVDRPCPFVSCSHNLYLDVNEQTGSIRYAFPERAPDDMPPDFSCALDVADRGGVTLQDLGRLTNVTRERIRQIEDKALHRLRRRPGRLGDFNEAPPGSPIPTFTGDSLFGPRVETTEERDAADDDEGGRFESSVSFFAEGERADDLVCASVWTMFVKDSNARGFAVSERAARWRLSQTEKLMTEKATVKRGELLAKVAEAHVAFEAKHGRAPTPRDLFEVLGPDVGKSVSNIYMALKRARNNGLLKRGAASPAKANGAKSRTNGATNGHVANGGGHHTSKKNGSAAVHDPVVDALIAKRDELADKVAALTVAIAALSEGRA